MSLSRFGKPVLNLALLLALAAGWPGTGAASPEFSSDSEHRGVVSIDAFQIFPENRPGNAVYLKNRLVVSLPEQTIVTIKPLPAEGRFVYLSRNVFGNTELGVHLPPTDPAPRVKKIAEGVYYAVMLMEGIAFKKVFRIVQENTIEDVLPTSKTADGITAGGRGLLFYHVASASTTEEDGRTVYQFALRLHLLMYEEERLRNLDYPIINTLPRLKLAWKDDSSVQYQLADGRVEVLSLAQFQ